MEKKLKSIDLISYFLKYFFLIISATLLIIGLINIVNFFSFVFDRLETKLCIYKSILSKNNIVSDFLITHKYDVYGARSYIFLDESTSILSITIFLRIFECLKYIFYAAVSSLIFILLNRYSFNKINDKVSNRYLIIISILFVTIPFLFLLRDFIGCTIINKLPINDPHIYFENFRIYYLLIGVAIFGFYLYNSKSFKLYSYYKKIYYVFFLLIFLYYFISNIGNLINLLNLKENEFIYHELLDSRHDFISILINNSFEIFGYNYTYLGYYTNLKSPLILFYVFESIINLSLLIIHIFGLYKSFKKNHVIKLNIQVLMMIIYIVMSIFNLIIMILVIDKYNDIEYYNSNLNYQLFNYEYLYYLVPTLFIYILSLNNSITNEKGNI